MQNLFGPFPTTLYVCKACLWSTTHCSMTLLPRQCRRLKRPHKLECAPDVYSKESECWSVNLGRHTYKGTIAMAFNGIRWITVKWQFWICTQVYVYTLMRAFKFMSTVLNCEFALSGVLVYVHMLILYYGSLTSVAYRMIYVRTWSWLPGVYQLYTPHISCMYTFLKYIRSM